MRDIGWEWWIGQMDLAGVPLFGCTPPVPSVYAFRWVGGQLALTPWDGQPTVFPALFEFGAVGRALVLA